MCVALGTKHAMRIRQFCHLWPAPHYLKNGTISENRVVYEIIWKKYCRKRQATDDSMAHAHCMLGTLGHTHTHTHTQYGVLIAFPLQRWLQESASMLCYT